MAGAVFVTPLHILGGVYCDIHGDEEGLIGFEFEHGALIENGRLVYKFIVDFDCPSHRSETGRVKLKLESGPCASAPEAERRCAMAAVEALRTQYGIFAADFNYILIAQQRQLYDAMRTTVGLFRTKYEELDGTMQECTAAIDELAGKISRWIGLPHTHVEVDDIVAASGLHAVLRDQSATIGHHVTSGRDIVRMLMDRDAPSQMEQRFEATVPMPMNIDWSGSFYTLRIIYNAALKKFNGEFEEINVVALPDGRFRASVSLSCAPYQFIGPECESDFAARSKVMFMVLEDVFTTIGSPIFDLHYYLRLQQAIYIGRYEQKMTNIHRCGLKLRETMNICSEVFGEAALEATGGVMVNDETECVLEAIKDLFVKIEDIRARFDEKWLSFENAKIAEAAVRASVADQN